MEALPLPQTKQSRWHNSTRGLAKQPLPNQASACLVWLASGYQKKRFWACGAAQASIALDVPKKAALLTPCKAQAALLWLSKKEVWLASGWLLAGFLVISYLPGGNWLDLPAASHKRSKVDGTIPRVGLRSSPGVDRLGRPEKGCTINSLQGPGCLAKSGLCLPGLAGLWLSKKEVWLASLASGWLSGWTSPSWKNLVLTWLKLAGPPRCLGAALWRHCPSHKRSKVDDTIPRMGLRSSPGVDRLGRPEKGCTINSLQGPGCLAKSGLRLPGLAGFWLSKKRGRGRRGRAAAALRLRGGQAVQTPGHERGPEAGLRLKRLRRNEVEEPDGHRQVEPRRHGPGHA